MSEDEVRAVRKDKDELALDLLEERELLYEFERLDTEAPWGSPEGKATEKLRLL